MNGTAAPGSVRDWPDPDVARDRKAVEKGERRVMMRSTGRREKRCKTGKEMNGKKADQRIRRGVLL